MKLSNQEVLGSASHNGEGQDSNSRTDKPLTNLSENELVESDSYFSNKPLHIVESVFIRARIWSANIALLKK